MENRGKKTFIMIQFSLLILGLFAGIAAGVFGIGGGLIIIPGLVYLFGYKQHLAQGTSLAILVLPVGILAAWRYWVAGHVQLAAVPWIAIGFVAGGLLGAHVIQGISDIQMKRLFGVFLALLAIKMIFGK
jgi:uncharacterized membrane protein YfcA